MNRDSRPISPLRPKRLLLILVALLASGAHAQLARGADPAAVADRAVEAWLAQEPVELMELAQLPPAELCRELPGLVANPPPPEGTRVNVDDRRELESDETGARRFTYSAVAPGDRLEVVQVTVVEDGDEWVAEQVGFRVTGTARSWLQQPPAAWAFVAFTVLIALLLLSPSFFRRWLALGAAAIRQHRGVVAFTMILLYGVFTLGVLAGRQLPDECADAVLAVVGSAIASVGATEAYGSGNVARAALVTFYQNFVVVTLSVTFTLALLLGIPAYLLSTASFFVQAIPFGLLGTFTGIEALFVLLLLLLELTAYFLVVSGGGMLLVSLFRGGFAALPEGVRKLALMLPIALILLLVGAWYEAAVLILGAP